MTHILTELEQIRIKVAQSYAVFNEVKLQSDNKFALEMKIIDYEIAKMQFDIDFQTEQLKLAQETLNIIKLGA